MALTALTSAQSNQLQAACSLMRQGRHLEALAISEQLVISAANAADAQQLLGMCQTEANNAPAAEQAFEAALSLAGDNPLILLNYATSLRKFGRTNALISVLQRAVGVQPKLARAWTELGVAAIAQDRANLACTALSNASKLEPSSAYVWHALGNAHRMTGRSDLGLAAYDRAVALGQPCPEVLDSRVGALMDCGRFAEALTSALEAVTEFPDFVPGRITLAHILWEHGSYLMPDRSPWSNMLERLRSHSQDHALRVNYISMLLSANLADQALAQIRLLRSWVDTQALATLEADALEQLGQAADAGKLYDSIYQGSSAHEAAFLNTYVRHLLKAGRWHEAERCALQATQAEPHDQQAWAYLSTAWRLLGDAREFWLCDYETLVTQINLDTPVEFDSTSDFLCALQAALDPLHRAQRAPMQQSVRGGSQTSGRLFGRDQPAIAAAQRALKAAADNWLKTLSADPSHPFLSYVAPDVRYSGSWSVKLSSQGKHVNHIHQQGWLSSAFYVALPPSMTDFDSNSDLGCLQLGQPPAELKLDLPARRIIRPKAGTLALFPSYFWHGTVPFVDSEARLSIAFDMQPQSS